MIVSAGLLAGRAFSALRSWRREHVPAAGFAQVPVVSAVVPTVNVAACACAANAMSAASATARTARLTSGPAYGFLAR